MDSYRWAIKNIGTELINEAELGIDALEMICDVFGKSRISTIGEKT
jgi:hypothetical protein